MNAPQLLTLSNENNAYLENLVNRLDQVRSRLTDIPMSPNNVKEDRPNISDGPEFGPTLGRTLDFTYHQLRMLANIVSSLEAFMPSEAKPQGAPSSLGGGRLILDPDQFSRDIAKATGLDPL